MNDTIAFPHLAELLAAKADISLYDAETFIRQFFTQIENSLAVASEVNIKGLGRFSLDVNNGICFTPDNDFAEYINQPFDMFVPVEITDEIAEFSEDSELSENSEDSESTETPKVSEVSEDSEPSTPRNRSHIIGYIITAVICLTLGYFLRCVIDLSPAPSVQSITEPDNIIPGDSIDIVLSVEADTTAEPEEEIKIKAVITDTVTPTRFLTTMARQYYGQMEYWVFIYLANEDKLGNPNRTRPGTVVIIPDKDEFTADETPEQTIARAKRLGREIYDRYE